MLNDTLPRSTTWLAAIMDRGTRMFERDKCHPCITLWSLGNEAGYGPAHDALSAWLRACDPSRPVMYEVGLTGSLAVCVLVFVGYPHFTSFMSSSWGGGH